MADLQNPSVVAGGGQEQIGFGNRNRNGFFHKHIHSQFHELAADACVFAGRYGDARCIDSAAQSFNIAEHGRAKFVGYALGAFGSRIHDADQLHPFELAVDARVIAPEVAHTDDGDAYRPLAHLAFAPATSLGA
jgi:hypothetical protein